MGPKPTPPKGPPPPHLLKGRNRNGSKVSETAILTPEVEPEVDLELELDLEQDGASAGSRSTGIGPPLNLASLCVAAMMATPIKQWAQDPSAIEMAIFEKMQQKEVQKPQVQKQLQKEVQLEQKEVQKKLQKEVQKQLEQKEVQKLEKKVVQKPEKNVVQKQLEKKVVQTQPEKKVVQQPEKKVVQQPEKKVVQKQQPEKKVVQKQQPEKMVQEQQPEKEVQVQKKQRVDSHGIQAASHLMREGFTVMRSSDLEANVAKGAKDASVAMSDSMKKDLMTTKPKSSGILLVKPKNSDWVAKAKSDALKALTERARLRQMSPVESPWTSAVGKKIQPKKRPLG